jgi:hypothetical protein
MIKKLKDVKFYWDIFSDDYIKSRGGLDALKKDFNLLAGYCDSYYCEQDGDIVAFGFFIDYNNYYEGCIIPTKYLAKHAKKTIKEMNEFIYSLGKPLETTSLDDKFIDKWHKMLGMTKIKEHTQIFNGEYHNLWRKEWA